MPLQFIMGSSGSGKSHRLYQRVIRESLENPRKNYIVIVPEQFTMQTQKDMVVLHPNHGIMNIDVVSFQRLAHRVFEEVGGNHRLVLEETGKNLIIRKAAGEKKEELQLLGKHLKKLGYINELKSVISEFMQYDIGTEQLGELADSLQGKGQLYGKLKDIALVYEAFREFLADRYITTEEMLEVLCRVIDQSAYIKNSVLAIDGFTGFTPVQQKLLEKLLLLSQQVIITVTIDPAESPYCMDGEHQLFYLSKKTVSSLHRLALETGAGREEDILIQSEAPYRLKENPPLAFLERAIFRYTGEVYGKEQDAVTLNCARNPEQELRLAAGEIKRLVREENYRYQDIAVVTGDTNVYLYYAAKVFESYEIPLFLDHKRSILLNSFIEYVRAALQTVEQNFSYESVFRYLRSGLTNLNPEEIDLLDNYAVAMGIRRKSQWKRKWVRKYRGLEEDELEKINKSREKVIAGFASFQKISPEKKTEVLELSACLARFLSENRLQWKLKCYEEQFVREGNGALAKEYAQVYKAVIDLLDKIVSLIGEEAFTVKEYMDLLDAGFAEVKIGVIPPSMDCVVVGDMERTRLAHIKALFIVGLNDGVTPKKPDGGGILSEPDRELLASKQLELAPTARQQMYIQKLYLYLTFTKPAEKLYLSFSKVTMEGKSIRPSYLVNTVQKLFSKLVCRDWEEQEMKEQEIREIAAADHGVTSLIDGLVRYREGKTDPQWLELFRWYEKQPAWKDRTDRLVDACFYQNTERSMGKAAAKALYGNVLENSVTRLERYAACAYAHFLTYGLRLSERLEYKFAAVDMGNLFHQALEIFSNKLKRNRQDWFHISKQDQERLIAEAVEECVNQQDSTVLYSSARNEYLITRMKRILNRTVWALCEQLKKGEFIPDRYEQSFGAAEASAAVNVKLTEEESMKLLGRIDRIDICEKEEGLYVKVLDYKSGTTQFSLPELYHGLQMQLPVYLNAAMELEQKLHPEKKVLPAGIFYYSIKDLFVEDEGETEQALEQKLLKNLRMNGLVNSRIDVIKWMDGEIEKRSDVLPVTLKKDGNVDKKSSVASAEQFSRLSQFVNRKMEQIGREILEGNVEINPYEMDKKSACDRCLYHGVCGFDPKIRGYQKRRLKKFDTDTVWEKLGKEEESNGNELDEGPEKGH